MISCKSSNTILSYNAEYKCDGIYYSKDKQKPAHFYKSGTLPLNINDFSIEYEFKTTEYRVQWPIILSKLYRVIGVKLSRNGNSYLTINNQRKSYNIDFEYKLNKWYKVKITHLNGNVSIRVDDKLLFKEELSLNKDFPKKDYVITSCNFSNGDCFIGSLKNIKVKTKKNEEKTDAKTISSKKSIPKFDKVNCEKIWEASFPNNLAKSNYINDIISKNHLTSDNIKFLKALSKNNQQQLAFKKILSPIFRLSVNDIGIFAFPKYNMINDSLIKTSKELNLITTYDTVNNMSKNFNTKLEFYPKILDSIFKNKPKPQINYYATNGSGTTRIKNLGAYLGECLEYYQYSFDTSQILKNDKVLFSSPFKIDLVFENNEKVDALLKNDPLNDCHDCPHSKENQKTFARVKGTDNLYFVYADTFPINNQLDTPIRALILVTKRNKVIYLWYEELDLFGCSCL